MKLEESGCRRLADTIKCKRLHMEAMFDFRHNLDGMLDHSEESLHKVTYLYQLAVGCSMIGFFTINVIGYSQSQLVSNDTACCNRVLHNIYCALNLLQSQTIYDRNRQMRSSVFIRCKKLNINIYIVAKVFSLKVWRLTNQSHDA